MKKLVVLLLSFFALTSTAEKQNVKPIFCPAEVVCTRMYDISSCSYDKQEVDYWGALQDYSGLIPGIYILKDVYAPYHAAENWTTDCFYNNESDEGNRTIVLRSKPHANIEIYNASNASWNIYMEDFGSCRGDLAACPLKEQASVLLQNMTDTTVWLSAQAYGGNDILTLPSGLPADYYAKLRYEQLGHCGDSDICSFDVVNNAGVIGTVTVDFNQRMKITSINPASGSLYTLEKLDGLNTINIRGEGLPSKHVIDVFNEIRTDILASVNGVSIFDKPLSPSEPDFITIPSVGKVSYERVTENCQNDICIVEFRTLQGMKIGSMKMDMTHDMAIVELTNHRPSEIYIEQTGQSSIAIKYPYIQS